MSVSDSPSEMQCLRSSYVLLRCALTIHTSVHPQPAMAVKNLPAGERRCWWSTADKVADARSFIACVVLVAL